MSKKRQVVLLAHGSSSCQWNEHMFHVVQQLNNRSSLFFYAVCFLEKVSPCLEDVAQELCHQGYHSFDLIPLFLAPGYHVTEDIPRRVSLIQERFLIQVNLKPFLGSSSLFVSFLEQMVEKDNL